MMTTHLETIQEPLLEQAGKRGHPLLDRFLSQFFFESHLVLVTLAIELFALGGLDLMLLPLATTQPLALAQFLEAFHHGAKLAVLRLLARKHKLRTPSLLIVVVIRGGLRAWDGRGWLGPDDAFVQERVSVASVSNRERWGRGRRVPETAVANRRDGRPGLGQNDRGVEAAEV